MAKNNIGKNNFSKIYRVDNGSKFQLKDWKTAPDEKINDNDAEDELKEMVEEISDLQNVLYADNKWSLLLIFQAMDAAGKDSTIKNILSGVNPQGCEVYAFGRPSVEELGHDFLWRTTKCLPQRGNIGVFNRSYYEEALVARVHPALLKAQHLPDNLVTEKIWEERFEDICAFEKHMARSGTRILKFFLHLSPEEQKVRFIERIENTRKNWKFDKNDLYERSFWKKYMYAYEETIKHTACEHAPWYVIPADNKAYARLAVADAVLSTLKDLDLQYPTLSNEIVVSLQAYKDSLKKEELDIYKI
ncbi:MAG: polyphosphate kinase 2 family protein [Advenella sp.]|nr:polyphosphate kinase 2 family protein [Advenella sp.]